MATGRRFIIQAVMVLVEIVTSISQYCFT